MSPLGSPHRARVFLSSALLLPLASVWRAAAPAVAQLSVATFFIAGPARAALGPSALWFVLAASIVSALARAIDIESWAALLPGGVAGRMTTAFGQRAASFALSIALVERWLLAALACLTVGHYAAALSLTTVVGWQVTAGFGIEDLATTFAGCAIGVLWLRHRNGREMAREWMARGVWVGLGIAALAAAWAVATLAHGGAVWSPALLSVPRAAGPTGHRSLDLLWACLVGFSLTLPVMGGGEPLARVANDLPPPRLRSLRRIALLTVALAVALTTLSTAAVILLVPSGEQAIWVNAPLAGLPEHLAGPVWLRGLLELALAAAALLVLIPAAHSALIDSEHLLQSLSSAGKLPGSLAAPHPRFGTPARSIDLTAAAVMAAAFASSGRVAWLARAYGMAIAVTFVVTVAALLKLRNTRQRTPPFRVPGNVRVAGHELPLGLVAPALLVAASAGAMLLARDVPSMAAIGLMMGVALWVSVSGRQAALAGMSTADKTFDLLFAAELSPDQIQARPGNLLVPVRNPYSLAHLAAALHTPGDRDIVVMTVRVSGADVHEDAAAQSAPTDYERHLFSEVVALSERVGRPVHLLIVPARNTFEAVAGAVVRLRSSDVYIGESSTLSADDQARYLGEAWERVEKPEPLDVQLLIYHGSGRADAYHLGAHPPSLSSGDLDLIHRLWLDAVRSVGPHVHHHDVVRAALMKMEEQLTGPGRDDALAAIREVARPAEELAAVLRAHDYGRLRDMLRNRHGGDVAALLTALSLEDQVLVFRVLPRKDAAAVFEYLSQDAKEALLKGMAQDDVAELLNNMAPDDRTLFLEELPAEATRQLLALLTPAERSVAVTLLGYPEGSVGRLMTPDYVAVQQDWSVRDVLDHVREHGHDSETLNHIYILDAQSRLIDDIRIRELLLAPLDKRVSELIDRRFVGLQATDGQEAAVAVFRRYDRTALPVTDTAGMLIGIVTIDDILDVAEASATRDIQRIGGSEALDEPYMRIAFGRMIQKRAGWLTALFLGEMLTATAMGFFEHEISRAVVLALFVPLIISSGGNSGSQAATLVIRALALGEVTLADWWRVMRREILAGLALGAVLGGIGFLRITVWSAFSNIYGPHWPLVALTVSLALVGVVLWGTLTGSLLPFALKRLGFDPAASSAPFVATLVDVTGLVIYFSVALVVLRGTLL